MWFNIILCISESYYYVSRKPLAAPMEDVIKAGEEDHSQGTDTKKKNPFAGKLDCCKWKIVCSG